jgi:tetratricopeptide (TPR) repeat protein
MTSPISVIFAMLLSVAATDDELLRAADAFRSEDFADVIEFATMADPDAVNPDAQSLIARAYLAEGDSLRAVDAAILAVEMRPESAGFHFDLGDAFIQNGKPALAIDSLNRAADLGFRRPVVAELRAHAYFGVRQDFGKVKIRRFPQAVEGRLRDDVFVIDELPTQPEHYRCAPAESAIYQAAVAIERPECPTLTDLLADPELTQDKAEEAVNVPRDCNVRDLIKLKRLQARIWQRNGYPARADLILDAMRDHVPQQQLPEFWLELADAKLAIGDERAFLQCTTKAYVSDPLKYSAHLTAAYRTLARCRSRRGDLNGYIKYQQQVVKDEPQSPEDRYRLANAMWEAGRENEAALHYTVTLKLQPDHPAQSRIKSIIASVQKNPETPTRQVSDETERQD